MSFSVEQRPTAVADTECYRNYWAIAFREVDGPRVRTFDLRPGERLDYEGVTTILRRWRIVTFNGKNYDMPMLSLALKGAGPEMLKRASDHIIKGGLRPWEFDDEYGVYLPSYIDHVDLMEVSPGSPSKPSLKIYAGRLHSKRMQDLPFHPDRVLSDADIDLLRDYLHNDLSVTRDLFLELKPQIELRATMSEQYGVDLRSKSDAQVAEAVIRAEIERLTHGKVYKPDVVSRQFRYTPPAFIRFRRRDLQELLQGIASAAFFVDGAGRVHGPDVLEKARVNIGESVYRLGIGGLHSSESSVVQTSDDVHLLLDRDVTSYYPNIILGSRLYPKHLGLDFLEVYRDLYRRRIAAKKAGDMNAAETLKIVLNGSFGKFGSPYSVLYSPHLMIQTTVTGQLAILMLIEQLELDGFSVVSANTDGFVTRVLRGRRERFEHWVKRWERATGFGTEETEYAALYSRDVNNYVAVTSAGNVKTKGAFAPGGPGQRGAAGMKKNPDAEIVTDAVIAWLKDGKPVEDTIRCCTDIRRFVSIRRVNGGAEKDDVFLGKAVRWYMGVGEKGAICYRTNGNTVPRTEGAQPCMELPEHFPLDVDYDWYIRQAYATLEDFGIDVADPALRGRTGWVYGRLPEQSTWHVIDLPHGVARCGREQPTLRDAWVEALSVPEGARLCKKCGAA